MGAPHRCRGLLHHPVQLVGLTLLLGAVAGCGRHQAVPVTGEVTLDGKPVEEALVTIHLIGNDREGAPATGRTDKSGAFRLKVGNADGARPGEYKVVITKYVSADPKLKIPDFPDTPEGRDKREHFLWQHFGDNRSPTRNVLPDKYGDLKATPLTCTVTDKPTAARFALTSK